MFVGEEMDNNSQQSVRRVARKLDMSTSTVYKTLKMKLHIKPCIFHQAQDLTIEHKRQRLEFLR